MIVQRNDGTPWSLKPGSPCSELGRWRVWAGVAGTILGLGIATGWAFTHAPVGSVIDNVEMPTLAGGRHSLLSDAAANVFIFFKPGLEYSNAFLKQIAVCAREMEEKPVHWVAVVSDRIPRDAVEAQVKESGLAMPVLIDEGDALFGRLGVALYPVVGIADARHKLVAYEPFRKIHYVAIVRAQIQRLLGEISEAELAAVLDPPKTTQGGARASALRRLRFADRLFQAGKPEKALENVRQSLSIDASLAAAHALLGKIQLAQGKVAEAQQAFEKALELDPNDQTALDGMKACRSYRGPSR